MSAPAGGGVGLGVGLADGDALGLGGRRRVRSAEEVGFRYGVTVVGDLADRERRAAADQQPRGADRARYQCAPAEKPAVPRPGHPQNDASFIGIAQ